METLLTLDDAERLAEEAISPEAWSYIVGGAGEERTLRWNREAFSRYRLRPRVLVDVTSVTTETTVLGTPVSMKAELLVIADQQRRGEYVHGACTHRPSHHESRQYPKPVS